MFRCHRCERQDCAEVQSRFVDLAGHQGWAGLERLYAAAQGLGYSKQRAGMPTEGGLQVRRSRRAVAVVLVSFAAFAVTVYVLGAPQLRADADARQHVSSALSAATAASGRAVTEWVLTLVSSEQTRYGGRYSERAFRNLKAWQSTAEVLSALGEPLARRHFNDGTSIWYYSEQKNQRANYLIRNVVFDKDGHLRRTFAEFYVD
jgi:outer membrane protein assembly factor BamE (lipoprotein component of BamABCDE complex)